MTITPQNTVYTQGGGTTSTSTFVDVFFPRAPNETDINYQIQQKWCDTSLNSAMPPKPKNEYWVLVGFSSLGGTVEAQWAPLGSSAMLGTLTGNSGGAVSPDVNNNINVVGDGTSINIVGNPATNTLTASLVTPVTVPEGGTGLTSLTPYGLLAGGTTSTGNVQQVGVGIANEILTSNGPGRLPTFQAIVLPTESLVINTQVFVYTGSTQNYTPSSGLAYAIVEVVGGGGGGGGCPANALGESGGGGGGGGGYSRKTVSSATIGASQTVTIGTGGAGGVAVIGSAGTATSFGSLVSASGGSGGGASTSGLIAVSGGSGGVGSSGDFNSNGGCGHTGFGGDQPGVGAFAVGGEGGMTIYGGGAVSSVKSAGGVNNGNNGTNYGSGGSGSVVVNSASTSTGGAGAPGICIVTEYIGGFATSFTWTDGSGTFTANPQMGYFLSSASTVTLPASPTEGITVAFVVDTASSVTITANTGQTIRVGNQVSANAGTAVNTMRGDSLNLVYRASDAVWVSTSTEGSWTIT